MISTFKIVSGAGRILCGMLVAVAIVAVCGLPVMAQDQEDLPTKNITLTLNNAPVKSAIEILFKSAGLNYSISPDVSGYVTVDLHDVAFDAALRTILSSVSPPLEYSYIDNIYNIKTKEAVETPEAPNPNTPVPGTENPGSQPGENPGTTPPTTGINPAQMEVIKLNYVDAGRIATAILEPPAGATDEDRVIVIPPLTNQRSGNNGGFGGNTGGSFGNTGYGGIGGSYGGSGYGGSSNYGGGSYGVSGGYGGGNNFTSTSPNLGGAGNIGGYIGGF